MSTAFHSRNLLIAVFVVISTFATTTVRAGKPVYVGQPSAQNVSMDQIDHATWNAILKKYVDKDGMVNYRALKANANDVQALNGYIQLLSTANPNVASKRNAQLAFWINAYNAVTVHGILRVHPTTSIRNHTAKLAGYNIWHDLQLYVGGKPYSLDSMEHKILRKMNEPRIHFAIVCASIGCPRLLNEAYTSREVANQLETNAKDFFSRSRNFRHDTANNRFYMSAIMDWFGSDFGNDQASQLRRIAGWLPNATAQNAALQNSVSVSHLDYDWNLNGK